VKHIFIFATIIGTFLFGSSAFAQQKVEFEYTGKFQTYKVPEGVTTIKVELTGAGGGNSSWERGRYPEKYRPGKGGKLTATYPVNPGETVYVFVGGQGDNATDEYQGKGGFNGGGDGNNTGDYGPYCGGGGGGASDIRIGGSGLDNRVLVAGGGGGAGSNYPDGGDHGGNGGGEKAKDGMADGKTDHESCGRGATQTAGGKGGQWPSYLRGEKGKFGRGGHAPDSTAGGGGGGGYYGGGAGSWSGGGGGSSFAGPDATDVKHEQGVNAGNGKITIEPGCLMPEVTLVGDTTICHGDEITLTGKSPSGAQVTWDKNVENGKPFKPWVGRNTYTMKSSNNKECHYTIDINVKPGAPVIVASDTAICLGEEITLEVEDMSGIVWDNGVKQGEPFAPPLGENLYKVSREGECAGTDEIVIRVYKLALNAEVSQIRDKTLGTISLEPSGGLPPYKYDWKDGNVAVNTEKVANKLPPGDYTVVVTDNIGCEITKTYTIDDSPVMDQLKPPGPKLEAKIDPEEAFVTVSYPGAFEYKIENEDGETVVTGHSIDEDVVDITRLPKGTYRVSLIYKQIKQYTTFTKH
jgi:hypothetical protein